MKIAIDGTAQTYYVLRYRETEQREMTAKTEQVEPMAVYDLLYDAFNHFNAELFNKQLSPCMVILHRHRSAYGYFCASRMAGDDAKKLIHEIALNPMHIRGRKPKDTISTFVHEMVHQWQQELGKPPKSAYHNKEWARKMHEVGLHPSNTAKPGGKETGRAVSHYIVKEGAFDIAFGKFEKKHKLELFGDLPQPMKKKNRESKFKYECPECEQRCWAKEGATLNCGECDEEMERAA